MQTLILSGNLAVCCEIVPGKEGNEFIRFTVAAKEHDADKDEKPTYYTCRMRKTGVAERLKYNERKVAEGKASVISS